MPRLEGLDPRPDSPRAHPNSFNLVPVRDVARAPGAPCPLPGGAERFDPVRSLFVRLHGQMRLFETRTTDFRDPELNQIRERGQIYADVSSKVMPDDFERDLRKLTLADECTECGSRSTCGGCWHPAKANVFKTDREHLETLLGSLEGSILDIGCGDGPYLRAIEARVLAGRATYLGVDPDESRIGLLRSRHPWAGYFAGDVFALVQEEAHRARQAAQPGRERRFRHILLLRCYNHLADAEKTVEVALSLLEPDGTLLIVDNVAFGLVRSTDQAARAERGTAGFEHFRNDGSDEAAALVDRPDLGLLARRDVTSRGSNEWLLHYQRRGTVR